VTPRSGSLILVGLTLLLAQACGNSASTSMNVTAPADTRCQASVANNASSFAAAGGTGTITVSVARECPWIATSRSQWVAITAGQQGQGDGSVTYRVSENHAPVARQAVLVVNDREVAVGQAAAPCQFEVSPSDTGTVAAQGDTRTVQLRTHELCEWAASSEVAWASVAPGSGRGNATLEVTIAPNTGASRPVTVMVAGHRIAVTQAALPAPPPPPPPPAPAPTPPPPPPPPAPAPAPPPPAPTPTPTPTPPPPPPPTVPTPVRQIRIDGRINDLAGSCPAVTFSVRGQSIYTTSETRYDDGRCQRLRNGRDVEIRGTLMSDGRVRADEVEIDD
jgi:hypothetical protein